MRRSGAIRRGSVLRAAVWIAVVTALVTLVIAHAGADAGAPASLEVDIADGVGAGEPELALDTVHHVVLISYTASEVCRIAVSSDHGDTWQIAPHPADPGPTPGIPLH